VIDRQTDGHNTDERTDGQNYDSQDRASIAASRGKKRDGQTGRQKLTFLLGLGVFGRPGGGRNPSPTKLSTVIEDLEHVLAPPKRLGSDA